MIALADAPRLWAAAMLRATEDAAVTPVRASQRGDSHGAPRPGAAGASRRGLGTYPRAQLAGLRGGAAGSPRCSPSSRTLAVAPHAA